MLLRSGFSADGSASGQMAGSKAALLHKALGAGIGAKTDNLRRARVCAPPDARFHAR